MEVTADQLQLVSTALWCLARDQPIWSRNFNAFKNMSFDRQIYWWQYAQAMSTQGLPMYRTLVAKVIQLRMS